MRYSPARFKWVLPPDTQIKTKLDSLRFSGVHSSTGSVCYRWLTPGAEWLAGVINRLIKAEGTIDPALEPFKGGRMRSCWRCKMAALVRADSAQIGRRCRMTAHICEAVFTTNLFVMHSQRLCSLWEAAASSWSAVIFPASVTMQGSPTE